MTPATSDQKTSAIGEVFLRGEFPGPRPLRASSSPERFCCSCAPSRPGALFRTGAAPRRLGCGLLRPGRLGSHVPRPCKRTENDKAQKFAGALRIRKYRASQNPVELCSHSFRLSQSGYCVGSSPAHTPNQRRDSVGTMPIPHATSALTCAGTVH